VSSSATAGSPRRHRSQPTARLIAILSRHCSIPALETSTICSFG
jgi:hypothetical protein